MKNSTLDTIFGRRSIRKFKRKQVSRDLINQIVEAGQRAPTACGMQTYSFILITDGRLRKEIYRLIGKQSCMEQAPVWIIVCADMARQLKLFGVLGVKTEFGPLGKFIPAVIDAGLTAENMVLAAEALGLGSVFIGSVWNTLKRIADLLGLPKNVLPLVLVCLGHPNESPPLRPRWPLEAVLHENRYVMPSEKLMRDYYEKANKELLEMGYFRKGINNWAEHWQAKFPPREMKTWEEGLRRDLKALGFMP
jgi:FMN reductase (NADPH)